MPSVHEDAQNFNQAHARGQANYANGAAAGHGSDMHAGTSTEEIAAGLRLILPPGTVTELRVLNTPQQTVSGYFDDPDKLACAAFEWDRRGSGVYFMPNPVLPALLARAQNHVVLRAKQTTSDKDITCRRFLLVDFDADRPAGISATETECEAAIARMWDCLGWLRTLGFSDLLAALSGNGGHILAPIALPNDIDSLALVKRCLAAIGLRFADNVILVDQTVSNAARICKLYGTTTCKGDSTPDRPHRKAFILEAPDQFSVNPKEVLARLASFAPEAPQSPPPRSSRTSGTFNLEEWISTHTLDVRGPYPWQEGKKWIFAVCPFNADHTNSAAYIVQFSNGAIAAGCHHNGCVGNDWHALRALYEPGYKEWRKKDHHGNGHTAPNAGAAFATDDKHDEEGSTLPAIIVNNRDLRDPLDESLDALRQKNSPPVLFERASVLVKVQRDERDRPFIAAVSEPVLRESLTRSADFIKIVGSKEEKKTIHVSPPHDVVQTLHARGKWQFPALVGLCECPVLRPDGTVLENPGYDPVTMLFYDPAPGLTIPALSATPLQTHAQEAAHWLFSELLVDFPFCTPADKANMLAGLLTPIVRPAINGCVPLCLIDKPGPGSGATLLSDVVATIATGMHAAKEVMPAGKNSEEEMRKRITSLLMAAKDVVVLDNIENALASSALSAVLSTPLWEDRLLSKNKIITLSVRTTWIATANNIAIRGDIARRSYRVRIDPKQDRPWTRDTFKHADLLAWTREHRGELLHALLTMARAWFAAGKPKPTIKTPKIGGFEEWVDIVGGILAYVDIEGFLGNLEELYSMVDEDAQQWRVFIATWHEELGEQSVTVAEIAGFGAESPALLEALPDVIDWDTEKFESSKKRLGKALKKRIDRHFGEYRLEQDRDDTHAKVSRWRVKKRGVSGV